MTAPRGMLLLLALVLAGSAAAAGSLATLLALRGASPATAPLAQAATPGCGAALLAMPATDPQAVLAAALGQPPAPALPD
ncbi:hypothetical protein, partial [Paracraurococcus ruber]